MKLFKSLTGRNSQIAPVDEQTSFMPLGTSPSEKLQQFRVLALSDSLIDQSTSTSDKPKRQGNRANDYGPSSRTSPKYASKRKRSRATETHLSNLKRCVDTNLTFFIHQLPNIQGLSPECGAVLVRCATAIIQLPHKALSAVSIQTTLAQLEDEGSGENAIFVSKPDIKAKRYLMSILAPLESILVKLAGGNSKSFKVKTQVPDEREFVICRICEVNVERRVLEEHSEYCSTVQEYYAAIEKSDELLLDISEHILTFVLTLESHHEAILGSVTGVLPSKVLPEPRVSADPKTSTAQDEKQCRGDDGAASDMKQNGTENSKETNDDGTDKAGSKETSYANAILKLIRLCTALRVVTRVATEINISTGSNSLTYSGQSSKALLSGLAQQLQQLETENQRNIEYSKYVEQSIGYHRKVKQEVLDRLLLVQASIDAANALVVLDSESTQGNTLLHSKSMRLKTVGIEDFELLKYLNRGGYARVYLARKSKTQDLFAVKVLSKPEMKERNEINHVANERHILSSISNRYIVQLYFTFQSRYHLFFVFEFLPGGDLQMMLDEVERFDSRTAKFYLSEIVLAVEFLHSVGVVHRDLKPSNVMVAKDGHIKLADFGLSKRKTGNSSRNLNTSSVLNGLAKSSPGTMGYCAPEVVSAIEHGPAVDLWGLGVVLFQFLTGQLPITGHTEAGVFQNVLELNIKWPEGAIFESGNRTAEANCKLQDTTAGKLIERLLVYQEDRLNLDQVKTSEYFQEVDWTRIHTIEPPFTPQQVKDDDTSYFAQPLTIAECANKLDLAEEIQALKDPTSAMCEQTIQSEGGETNTEDTKYLEEDSETSDEINGLKSTRGLSRAVSDRMTSSMKSNRSTFADFDVTMVNGLSLRNLQLDSDQPSTRRISEVTTSQVHHEPLTSDEESEEEENENWTAPTPRIRSQCLLTGQVRNPMI